MFDPNAQAPAPGTMQTMGAPISLGGFPANQPNPMQGGKNDAFMTALQGWRDSRDAWRDSRPEHGQDRAAMMAWRQARPERPDFRALRGLSPQQPGGPLGAPQMPQVVSQMAMPQAAAGNYGTSLGVIGATPATSPTALPVY